MSGYTKMKHIVYRNITLKSVLLLVAASIVIASTLFISHINLHGDYEGFKALSMANPGFSGAWHVAIQKYLHWSSRFLIEFSVVYFAGHLFLWGIITVVSLMVIAQAMFSFSKYSVPFNQRILIGMAFFLFIFPVHLLDSAGVFATTINYEWPVASFILGLYLTKRALRASGFKKILCFGVGLLFLLFSINSEQVSVFMIVFGGLNVLVNYRKQGLINNNLVVVILGMLGAANAKLAPGNALRMASEIKSWWPGFNDVQFYVKAEGIFQLGMKWLLDGNILFVAVLLVFMFNFYIKNKRTWFIVSTMFTLMLLFPEESGVKTLLISNIQNSIHGTAFNSNLSIHVVGPLFVDFILFGILVLVVGMFISAFRYDSNFHLLSILAISAFSTWGMMILSPTMIVSRSRPMTIFALLMILIVLDKGILPFLTNKTTNA